MNKIVHPITYDPPAFEDVLSRRASAFVTDMAIICVLFLLACIPVLLIGLVTFGLGWILFTVLFQIVAVFYTGLTLGGPQAATFGMRVSGLKMQTVEGDKPGFLVAVLHIVLFWVLIMALTPLILLVGLLDERKRLLHDILIGAVVSRAGRTAARTKVATF